MIQSDRKCIHIKIFCLLSFLCCTFWHTSLNECTRRKQQLPWGYEGKDVTALNCVFGVHLRSVSRVMCDKTIGAKVKVLQYGRKICCVVWLGDSGTNKKTFEDVKMFYWDWPGGRALEMSISEGDLRSKGDRQKKKIKNKISITVLAYRVGRVREAYFLI